MTAPQTPAADIGCAGAAPCGGPQNPDLTPKEQQLLAFLQAHPGEVFTRRELLAQVWDTNADQRTRTVDQHIAALRRKCGLKDELLTVCRRGYLYRAG